MGRISFFTMLADDNMSWIERDAINSVRDDMMEVASAQAESFGQAIAQLNRRLAAADRQIALLRAAVGVLAAMLRDNSIVDGEMLDARLEAAILNAEEEVVADANTVSCTRCGQAVARARTMMTEDGVVCDRCHAGA